MTAVAESLLARVSALPPLPESAVRLRDACRDPRTGPAEIAAVLADDPMLTSNVLKVVNSPFYGLTHRVTSVGHAVGLLGYALVRGFALAASVRAALPADLGVYGLDQRAFAAGSARQRAAVAAWYDEVVADEGAAALVVPTAFVMDMGLLPIAAEVKAAGRRRAFREALRAGEDPVRVERRHVGCDRREAAALLFEHWRFDPEIVALIRAMAAPDRAEPPRRERAALLVAVAGRVGFDRGRLGPADLARFAILAGGEAADLETVAVRAEGRAGR